MKYALRKAFNDGNRVVVEEILMVVTNWPSCCVRDIVGTIQQTRCEEQRVIPTKDAIGILITRLWEAGVLAREKAQRNNYEYYAYTLGQKSIEELYSEVAASSAEHRKAQVAAMMEVDAGIDPVPQPTKKAKSPAKVLNKVPEGMTNARRIYNLIRRNGALTARDLIEKTGLDQRMVAGNLTVLFANGFVNRVKSEAQFRAFVYTTGKTWKREERLDYHKRVWDPSTETSQQAQAAPGIVKPTPAAASQIVRASEVQPEDAQVFVDTSAVEEAPQVVEQSQPMSRSIGRRMLDGIRSLFAS